MPSKSFFVFIGAIFRRFCSNGKSRPKTIQKQLKGLKIVHGRPCLAIRTTFYAGGRIKRSIVRFYVWKPPKERIGIERISCPWQRPRLKF